MASLKNITLEMSLKPFKKIDDDYITGVCRKMFSQWNSLLKYADMVSVLLWSADGSEILEYKGDMNEAFDWARYIGGVNPTKKWNKELDPQGVGIHTKGYLYMENPPVFTYGILKKIVETIKSVGRSMTGKPVRVGATFDPGPEFAVSEFKYKRHREICLANTYGESSFVCCYGILHRDECRYAGFPDGIPEGTSMGTFLGRQSQLFLKDLNFDFLWLSNGFGFGCENWGITGALFDGEKFQNGSVDDIREKIIGFWRDFRKECPEFRVETRGTNLTTGVDLSTDGVPLKDIYRGGFNIMPPPNSPWAAINRDFGLEIVGYMSRVAELPEKDFMFRFYVHDPWWMNSPWIDRYEGLPYDIYIPLAISRLDEEGNVHSPSYVNFLTIDNSLGEMPDRCPNEIIPHILSAYEHAPDAVSPFTWIYPFDMYHTLISEKSGRQEEIFFGDWFIRGAVNEGLPVSTVVSDTTFIRSNKMKPGLYDGSVMISPVPVKDSEYEEEITGFIRSGGKVLFYGPLENAGQKLLGMLNLVLAAPLEGLFDVTLNLEPEDMVKLQYPRKLLHRKLLSGGGICAVVNHNNDPYTEVLALVENEYGKRVISVSRSTPEWNGGKAVWVRGTNSCHFEEGEWLPGSDNPEEYFYAETLMRRVLGRFGYNIGIMRKNTASKSPVMMVHRSNNAFYFSGFSPDTTVPVRMRFPLGAPLLIGMETEIRDGHSVYHFPRSWRHECRVFAETGRELVLSCTEYPPVSHYLRRRIRISGLNNTTLRIFPEKGCERTTELHLNSKPDDHLVGEFVDAEWKESEWGSYIEVRNVTGTLLISTPFDKKVAFER